MDELDPGLRTVARVSPREFTCAAQILGQPRLDDRSGANRTGRRRIMWSQTDNQIAWRWYLGEADPEVTVPARNLNLRGLAPAWIGVGTLDLFLAECNTYAERLQAAEVPVCLKVAEGAFHGFDQFAPSSSVALDFFASQCDYLRSIVAG
ncbi:alpha/beta hydrolase fold domain-containing protein [Mycobacterium sp. 94-17]|uniref:alpha/beta hydrolase fold domain-containing protein n=1 Tax=Mycobacterium sp. 94-17 TaxID=2986147 RepID=UPI002D1EEAB9|nr:alpha/beta hydrolase fold domain-containing protein [Mycobacterium sp. 94-17]MEB4209542.1 alpha/beta hydrolase fold domain-containing protein [Mycobacterium sp. 94-17]